MGNVRVGYNKTLESVFSTLKIGGQETRTNPPNFACAHRTHEPFRISKETIQLEDETSICGVVRTIGAQFDGDRTDLHEVFSLVWAATLRAFGLTSPWLIPEPHGFVPEEIGAVHLVFCQCPWSVDESLESSQDSMNAWSAFIFHLLNDVFRWDRVAMSTRPDPATTVFSEPDWAAPLIKYLRSPDDASFLKRRYPLWSYFSSQKRGVTVLRMPQVRIRNLKSVLKPFSAGLARGEEAYCVFANGIPNTVPFRVVKRVEKIMATIGDTSKDLLMIPIDSHCLFIGHRTIVAIRQNCGKDAFDKERTAFVERRASENLVFFADSTISWLTPLDASAFESLALELIKREPGVVRAKPVGTTNDRDRGRDILVDWRIPLVHKETLDSSTDDTIGTMSSGSKVIQVLVQVKTRSKTIGKGDVQDVRDTLEYHQADAYFLIAYPRTSAALVDYLENLRKTTGLGTDWWEASDIEDRLRRHPDVAMRFQSLVQLSSSA